MFLVTNDNNAFFAFTDSVNYSVSKSFFLKNLEFTLKMGR